MIRTPSKPILCALACLAFDAGLQGGDEYFGEFASLVSRDALLYVYVDDREAFVRRADATSIGRAIVEYDSEELEELFTLFAAESSLFLAPDAVRAFGYVLEQGRGELALAVEGVIAVGQRVEPEVLAIAENHELQPLFDILLRLAKGDEDAEDDLEDLELPFPIDLAAGVATSSRADAQFVEFDTGAGARIVVAAHGARMLVSSRVETIERALERARNPSFGSLRDSLRFRELWRSLAPGRGSLVTYANLRRMRETGRVTLGGVAWAKHALDSRLAAFDGLGLAVRGVGRRFETWIELERGRSTGEEALLRENVPLSYLHAIPNTHFVASLRLDAEQAVPWIENALWAGGNLRAREQLASFVSNCGGSRAFEPLARAVGGEFSLFLIGAETSIDPFPRIGARFQLKDRSLLDRTLLALSTAIPERVRRGRWGGETLYSFRLEGGVFATDPTVVVRDDAVFAATSPNHMRVLLEDLAKKPRLDRERNWLSGWDALEASPSDPAVAHVAIDAAKFAEAARIWVQPLFPVFADDPRLGPLVAELFHAIEDPDIQEALSPITLRAESRPSGVRIEMSGP